MNSQPKVTVVLPVRDAEHRIFNEVRRILDVLADISRQRSELIIVDDGSIDTTLEILDEIVMLYPQVRIARHTKPRGIEAAGQTGLEKATGEFFMWFADDDDKSANDRKFLQNVKMQNPARAGFFQL